MSYADKDKRREYQKKWVAARRSTYFWDKQCESCGSTTNLELHHRDRETKVTHKVWSWKKENREAELNKCSILCKSCHLETTKLQITLPLIHGTNLGYDKKCRCELCRKAHAQRILLYRQRKSIG